MGTRGTATSMSPDDLSASYVTLGGLIGEIGNHVGDIMVHQKALEDIVNNGGIDEDMMDQTATVLGEINSICNSINASLTEVKKNIDSGIRQAEEIKQKAKSRAESVNESVKSTGKRFKR